MGIDYERFDRLLDRSAELAAREDVDPSVKRVYDDKLAADATTYRASHDGLKNAEVVAKKEHGEELQALEDVDQPYLKARTVTKIYVKDLAVPETLKSLSTDTDKRDALRSLLEILDANDDSPGWAADLTSGDFGRLAPIAIQQITEWITADGNLETAVHARQEAYAKAYERFLEFRDVVRATYTSSSIHYRRLLVRSSGTLAVEDPSSGGGNGG